MLQQSAQPPEALNALCDQLPLDLQVQLTHYSQADNATTAVQTALDSKPAATPPSAPSTNGDFVEPGGAAAVGAPSTTGDFGTSEVARRKKPPSTNGEIQRRSRPPKLAGFDWLGELRRAFGGRAPT